MRRKVWVFLGDGEMDEPESLGAIGLAAREKLDNLIFVINCNLQRLDGRLEEMEKLFKNLKEVLEVVVGTLLKLFGVHIGISFSLKIKVVF